MKSQVRKQRGLGLIGAGIYLLIFVVVTTAVTYVIGSYNEAIEEAVTAKQNAEVLSDLLGDKEYEVKALERENAQLQKQLVKRQEVRNAINREAAQDKSNIQDAKSESTDVTTWANTPIPAILLERLRNTGQYKNKDGTKEDTSSRSMASEASNPNMAKPEAKDK